MPLHRPCTPDTWRLQALCRLSFLDEYEDFQLQEYESPWGNAYRIIAPRKNLQLAFADTKDAIINDWKIIESNYQKEVLKTSTECMSGEYFKNFFKKLWQEEKMKEAAHSGESNNPSSLVQSHDADEFLLLPSPRESGRVLEAVATGGEAKEINAIIEEEGEQSIHFQDSFGRTALHIAAEMGSLEVVKLLLKYHAQPNIKDKNGWTALHSALQGCDDDHIQCARVILDNGALLTVAAKDGCSPIHYLVRNRARKVNYGLYLSRSMDELTETESCANETEDCCSELLEIMLERGAPVNSQNKTGNTALHEACLQGDLGLAKILVRHGAKVNIKNQDGETPMHFAVCSRSNALVRYLYSVGANLNIAGSRGTPKEMAQKMQLMHIESFLQQRHLIEKSEQQQQQQKQQQQQETNHDEHAASNGIASHQRSYSEHSDSAEDLLGLKLADAQQNPHSFVLSNVGMRSWCKYCHGFVWSLAFSKNAYCCEVCKMVVHRKCHRSAQLLTGCHPKTESDESASSSEPSPESERAYLDEVRASITPAQLATLYERYFSMDELSVLYDQFVGLDRDEDGKVTVDDLVTYNLGAIMDDSELANHFFSNFNDNGFISFKSFVQHMSIPLKGTSDEKLEFAFKMYSDADGLASVSSFKVVVEAVHRVLKKMRISTVDAKSFVETWLGNELEEDGQPRRISLDHFKERTLSRFNYVKSLGLLKEDDETTSKTVPSSRSIIFGHKHWDLVQAICWAIRISVGEAYREPHRKFKPKDFKAVAEFSLDNPKTEKKWILRDYAPRVFRNIRDLCSVDQQWYMYSLGPEKILGNLLVGSFSALCEVLSSGRSSSIFFKSIDNRYLIKTIPASEHLKLLEILPDYFEYIQNNPNTLLTRILGCHQLVNKQSIDFIVMQNIFGEESHQIHEQYDLKGSTVDRNVKMSPGQTMASIAMKDNDFQSRNHKINLIPEQKALFIEQIEKDCRFLEDRNICDYSLLVGFHFLSDAASSTASSAGDSGLGSTSIFKKDFGGVLSADEKVIYYLGIIDHLTTFDFKKMAESGFKSIIHDSTKISAMPPKPYRTRFQKFVASILE